MNLTVDSAILFASSIALQTPLVRQYIRGLEPLFATSYVIPPAMELRRLEKRQRMFVPSPGRLSTGKVFVFPFSLPMF